MQNRTNRLQWAVLLVALRLVGVVMLCVAVLSFTVFHSNPGSHAAGPLLTKITGTISSSPSTGPAGTAITVSGSGWGGTDGTSVSFGYQVNSSCSIVSDSQDGTLSGGSFSGWFRWPSGTALNTFRVCAMLGNVMGVAGSFSVLSSSPPAVSISPTTLAPNTLATITASNYYPAGTQVNFLWMSGNTVVHNLNSVTSDTSGVAILTFTVPKLTIASGSYSINANAGGGQPATLSSSTNFTYNAPIVPPSPTSNPSPTPSPVPSPTMTPGATPTATATTATTPTVGVSPTVGNSSTPTSNGTNSGNNSGSNTGAPTSSSSDTPLIVGGIAVLLAALVAAVVVALLISRRRKAELISPTRPNSPGLIAWTNPQSQGAFMNNGAMPPLNNGQLANPNPNAASYPPYNSVSRPGPFAPQPNDMPVPVGAGAVAGNGNATVPAGSPPPLPPVSLSPQPPAWLANVSSGGSPAAGENASPTIAAPADPALDAMRRQAQAGLFAAPRPFKDERSQ